MTLELNGLRGLIVGVANEHSIAWGCAQACHAAGARLALSWLNDKARPFVAPLADRVQAEIAMPLDVEQPGQLEALFDTLRSRWGGLDFLVHSIAFAPREDLQGRVLDCSAAGFARAMDVSCHSFLRMARLAEPLMSEGGSLVTMSYLGADEVVGNYGMMGPVKAALESSVRYLAAELGPRNINVNAISPGPVATRAASGLPHFDQLLASAQERAPLQRLVQLDEVGALCRFLVSPTGRAVTGHVIYADAGLHILA